MILYFQAGIQTPLQREPRAPTWHFTCFITRIKLSDQLLYRQFLFKCCFPGAVEACLLFYGDLLFKNTAKLCPKLREANNKILQGSNSEAQRHPAAVNLPIAAQCFILKLPRNRTWWISKGCCHWGALMAECCGDFWLGSWDDWNVYFSLWRFSRSLFTLNECAIVRPTIVDREINGWHEPLKCLRCPLQVIRLRITEQMCSEVVCRSHYNEIGPI